MGAEEKNRNEILSRIAAELFVQSKDGEELSSKIQRLRDELKKVIESEDTIFGKFLGLAESFREIIPDEKQRYNAAIKALSTTSKVSTRDIVTAVNNQLEELKILEKVLLSAPSGGRDDLKVMEAKSQELREEISKLREKIGQLESEEKVLLNSMATQKKDMEFVSKAVGELFKEIATEITYINKKVAEVTSQSTASQPILPGDSVKIEIPSQEKGAGEQKIEILEPSAPKDMELQKSCPMCGGRMDLSIGERKWRCYSCGFEELKKEEKGRSGQISEIPELSAKQDTEWQKKCPMCGGRMDFYMDEEKWICFSCAFEEPKEGDVQDKNEVKIELEDEPERPQASGPTSKPAPSIAVPLADMPFDAYQEPKKRSSPPHSQASSKKKTCPACRKRMSWHEEEKAWRCSFCGYERSI